MYEYAGLVYVMHGGDKHMQHQQRLEREGQVDRCCEAKLRTSDKGHVLCVCVCWLGACDAWWKQIQATLTEVRRTDKERSGQT